MSATWLYRIAAVLLLLFAVGHTMGFLRFVPPTPEGVAVRDAMDRVVFDFGGAPRTYTDFYRGFGLTVTGYLVFGAALAWWLGGFAATTPQSIGWIGWAFAAVEGVGLVLSVRYFFIVPAVFSGLVVLCLAGAAWQVRAPG